MRLKMRRVDGKPVRYGFLPSKTIRPDCQTPFMLRIGDSALPRDYQAVTVEQGSIDDEDDCFRGQMDESHLVKQL